jgi:hypothetical protein
MPKLTYHIDSIMADLVQEMSEQNYFTWKNGA